MKGPGSRSWIDLSLLFSFFSIETLSITGQKISKSLKNGSDRLRKGTTVPGASSETQGQSVGSGEKAGRKFSSTEERAPGYRLSPNYFEKFKQMPVPDWAQKINALYYCAQSANSSSWVFFSWVRTRQLLSRSRLVWLMHQRNACSQETFSLI